MAFSPPLMFWEKLTIKKEIRETYTGKHILSSASGSRMASPAVTSSAGGLGSREVPGDHADAPLSSPHSRAQAFGPLAPPPASPFPCRPRICRPRRRRAWGTASGFRPSRAVRRPCPGEPGLLAGGSRPLLCSVALGELREALCPSFHIVKI